MGREFFSLAEAFLKKIFPQEGLFKIVFSSARPFENFFFTSPEGGGQKMFARAKGGGPEKIGDRRSQIERPPAP